jgi:hypothetical protein
MEVYRKLVEVIQVYHIENDILYIFYLFYMDTY